MTRAWPALWTLGLAACLSSPTTSDSPSAPSAAAPPPPPRHLLLITLDTTRRDRLGTYGHLLADTQRLDRLADEGVRCDDATAVAGITLPTHTSIMTGLLPPAHGVRDNGNHALAPQALTLAERLGDAGWATGAFVSAVVLQRRYGLDQGFEVYDDDLWTEDDPPMFMIRSRPARRTIDQTIAWWDTRDEQGDDRPRFTWVHLFDAHQPYTSPLPAHRAKAIAQPPYDREITTMDVEIGRMLDDLQARGQLDETLIVVTADHGEALGEHGEKTHGLFVYDGTIRIPMIWWAPGALPAGQPLSGPVSQIDVLPTALSLLGQPVPDDIQGLDLSPALRGEAPSPRQAQYAESILAQSGFGFAPLFSIRTGGHKAIRAPRPELYDLAADPRERTNLLPDQAAQAAPLWTALEAIEADSERVAIPAIHQDIDAATRETLLALGYLSPDPTPTGPALDPKDGLRFHRMLEQARHLIRDGRADDAEATLTSLLDALPDNLSALNLLGTVHAGENRREQAVEAWSRSLALDPAQSRIHVNLARAAMGRGDLATATSHAESALTLTPGSVEALNTLGLIAYLSGDDAGAFARFQQAVDANPGAPKPLQFHADLLFERKRWTASRDAYQRVIAAGGGNFGVLMRASQTHRETGDPATALALLDQGEALKPDHWQPPYDRACLWALQGRRAEAIDALRTAAVRDPHVLARAARDHDLVTVRDALRGLRQELAASHAASATPDGDVGPGAEPDAP